MFQVQNQIYQYPLSLTSSIRNQMISHLQIIKSRTYVYLADVSNRQKVKRQLHFLTLPDDLYQQSKLRLTLHMIWLLQTEQEDVWSFTLYRKLLIYTIIDFHYKEIMNMFRYVVIKYGYQFKSDYLICFQCARYLRLFTTYSGIFQNANIIRICIALCQSPWEQPIVKVSTDTREKSQQAVVLY